MNLSAIRNLFNQLLIIGFLVISIFAQSFSQTSNQYGLRIISDVRFYNDQVLKDSNMNLLTFKNLFQISHWILNMPLSKTFFIQSYMINQMHL